MQCVEYRYVLIYHNSVQLLYVVNSIPPCLGIVLEVEIGNVFFYNILCNAY